MLHIIRNRMDTEEVIVHPLRVKECGLHFINPIDMIHIT